MLSQAPLDACYVHRLPILVCTARPWLSAPHISSSLALHSISVYISSQPYWIFGVYVYLSHISSSHPFQCSLSRMDLSYLILIFIYDISQMPSHIPISCLLCT